MRQYNRQVRVILGSKGYDSEDFDFEFEVEFDDTPNLNHAEVIMYNLSNTSVNEIKSGMPMILNAGYEGDVGSVFVGATYDMHTKFEGVDRVTIIRAVDASDQRGKLRVNRSYKKGIRASQIIVDLCGLYGISVGAIDLPKDVQYRNGKNVSGQVLSILRAIAKDCKAKFHINKGLAYFMNKNKGQNINFIFSSDTGLLGSPSPFVEEDPEKEGREIRGYNVDALLNHRVQADSIIEVRSSVTNGKYRVRSGTHSYTPQEMVTRMEVV